MRIERHVFGSYSGYTTLAYSAGLSAEDCRALEGAAFGFGQTDDRRYFKSLRGTPAYFTQTLPRGRRSLTRVLPGAPDDNGRATLLMISAVVGQSDWDAQLCGDVQPLFDDRALWDYTPGGPLDSLERAYPAPRVSLSRSAAAKVLDLVSAAEAAYASGATLVVSEHDFGADEMRALELLVPPTNRSRVTTGFRSLGADLAVMVNCLSAAASQAGVTHRYTAGGARTPYADFLAAQGLASGHLPLPDVITYQGFGDARSLPAAGAVYTPPPPSAVVPAARSSNTATTVITLCATAVIFFGAGALVGVRYLQSSGTEAAAATQSTPAPSPADPPTTRTIQPPVATTDDPVTPTPKAATPTQASEALAGAASTTAAVASAVQPTTTASVARDAKAAPAARIKTIPDFPTTQDRADLALAKEVRERQAREVAAMRAEVDGALEKVRTATKLTTGHAALRGVERASSRMTPIIESGLTDSDREWFTSRRAQLNGVLEWATAYEDLRDSFQRRQWIDPEKAPTEDVHRVEDQWNKAKDRFRAARDAFAKVSGGGSLDFTNAKMLLGE